MLNFLHSPSLLKNPNLIHGFSTKPFGIPFNDEHRRELSIAQITQKFSLPKKNLILLSQIHSSNVVIVNSPLVDDRPQADALITATPGLLLGILTADCVPILLSSKNPQVIAAIHAGWRGAKAGIIKATVLKMRILGACDITAALGPCIWQQSYEVADDFYNNFKASAHQFFLKGHRLGHWYFDLPGYVYDQLLKNGVENIEPSLADTYTTQDQFFSYRRKTHHPTENLEGNISVIGIKPSTINAMASQNGLAKNILSN